MQSGAIAICVWRFCFFRSPACPTIGYLCHGNNEIIESVRALLFWFFARKYSHIFASSSIHRFHWIAFLVFCDASTHLIFSCLFKVIIWTFAKVTIVFDTNAKQFKSGWWPCWVQWHRAWQFFFVFLMKQLICIRCRCAERYGPAMRRWINIADRRQNERSTERKYIFLVELDDGVATAPNSAQLSGRKYPYADWAHR